MNALSKFGKVYVAHTNSDWSHGSIKHCGELMRVHSNRSGWTLSSRYIWRACAQTTQVCMLFARVCHWQRQISHPMRCDSLLLLCASALPMHKCRQLQIRAGVCTKHHANGTRNDRYGIIIRNYRWLWLLMAAFTDKHASARKSK